MRLGNGTYIKPDSVWSSIRETRIGFVSKPKLHEFRQSNNEARHVYEYLSSRPPLTPLTPSGMKDRKFERLGISSNLNDCCNLRMSNPLFSVGSSGVEI